MGNQRPRVKPKASVWRRGLSVGLMTFGLAIAVSYLSQGVRVIHLALAFLVLLGVIALGVAFDIVGVAVTATREGPFHARAAKRLPGSRQSVLLVKSADRVANFCNDVVGDVAASVSGAAGAAIAARLAGPWGLTSEAVVNILVIAGIAGLTVGAKAIGKNVAMRDSDRITYRIGQLLGACERFIRRLTPAPRGSRGRRT
ncbi:MAG: hypothetical protein AB1492_04130 [Bacillota bacterium]